MISMPWQTGVSHEEKRWSGGAALFVWGVWGGMVAIALWHFAYFTRNMPWAEDWLLVAAMTGREADLGSWLWSQNNEHRLPVPRLAMLALLKVTGGNFRSGAIFNIAMVALLAAGMIEVARRVRGGTLRYTDAFFPIVLLEVGDWQDLFWTWQMAFVLSVVLVGLGILAIVRRPALDTPGAAAAIGGTLVMAPLTGGSGLLFMPPLMLYAGLMGLRLARRNVSKSERSAATTLIGSVVVAGVIIALYLLSYERPGWVPANPGVGKSIIAALQFQAFGLGPAVRTSWNFWIGATLLVLLMATFRVAQNLIPRRRGDPPSAGGSDLRALGVFACLLSVAGFAAGMGWGRAAVIDVYGGWPDRYVLLAAPAFCVAYFAFEQSGSAAINRWGRALLFALAAILLPTNMAFGREWGIWWVNGADYVAKDIRAGTPRDVLATRHRDSLSHQVTAGRMAELMQMLHDQGTGPFAAMVSAEDASVPPRLSPVTLRYHLPEAGAVNLVWWFRSGRLVPLPIRPPGTTPGTRGSAVSTPMQRDGSAFTVTLQVPPGDVLEYGFMTVARNDGAPIAGVWDASPTYAIDSTEATAVVDVQPTVKLLTSPLGEGDTALVSQRIRYGPTDAHRVSVVWGIDGWQRLPDALLPPQTTTTASHLSLTAMERTGTMFEVTLPVPAGRRLEFTFELYQADRRVADRKTHRLTPTDDASVTIEPSLSLAAGSSLETVLKTGLLALVALGLFAGLSALVARKASRA